MYQSIEQIQNTIHALTKERTLMNITQFDLLMKRVNLEEDVAIKEQMLTAVNQYLVVLGQGTPAPQPQTQTEKVADIAPISAIESVKEDVVAGAIETPNVQVPAELEEIAKASDNVEIIMVTDNKPAVETAPAVEEAKAETPVVEETPESDDKEEAAVPKAELEVFVEEFGLISPASDEQMNTIIAEGGVLYQEKRSFMLNLFLKDELVAVAKTISLKEFPESVKQHMKAGGVVTCDVHSFTEPKNRSRARYTDVTFSNLNVLADEEEIAVNVKALLENGELPEHAKAKLEEEKAKEEAAKQTVEPVKETAVEPVKEEAKEEAPATDAKATSSEFLINPNFVGTLENQKKAVLEQQYGIKVVNGLARLFTNGANGAAVIGVNEKSSIEDGNHVVKILDYEMTDKDGKSFGHFTFESSTIANAPAKEEVAEAKEEVAAPETPAVEPEKTEEPVQAEKAEEVKVEEVPSVQASPAVPEAGENPLNKTYVPEEARELINPTANADHAQGYQDLVGSQAKDMGGAIEQIRTQTEVTPSARNEITGAVTGVIQQTLRDTNMQATMEAKSTTAVMGNIQDGAGNLTQTQTVIQFATTFNATAWEKSIGKEIPLYSQLEQGNGPMTSKLVKMVGKNGAVVGQARVPITEALLMDGNQHTARLLAVQNVVQQQQGYIVSLLFGEFKKVA